VDYYTEIYDRVGSGDVRTKEELHRLKVRLCKTHGLKSIPTDADLLSRLPPERSELASVFLTKPSRTISGVAIVAAMTSPAPCPHGTCIYCPGGPRFSTPQSYTGHEPAAMRGARNDFDPYRQTRSRIQQLRALGHVTDKVDLIVMGGTFTARDPAYQTGFVKGCFDGLNGFVSETLGEAQAYNETGPSRCIGLTVETKPERVGSLEAERLLNLGATRVELGVQILDDAILLRVNRGHTTLEIREATKAARDAGLKICYHLMPGLPGSSPEKDLASFQQIFEDPDYRPDMVKIYPTLIIAGTGLYEMYRRGEYAPMDTDSVVELVARMKELVPPWVRIQRIQRDIPVPLVVAGLDKGHVRELAQRKLREWGKRCRCIRCREVGRNPPRPAGEFEVRLFSYSAAKGKEYFVTYEDTTTEILAGYVRARFSDQRGFVRELKVFGPTVPVGTRPRDRWQHHGLGKRLMQEAERLALDEGYSRLLVTSGVGVREYYRKLGYNRLGPYMSKDLTPSQLNL